MIIMSTEEWKTKSEAWKQGYRDYHTARDMSMTKEEKANQPKDWYEGLKYAAAHFIGGVRPMGHKYED